MIDTDALKNDKVMEVAKIIGYDPNKPQELNKYIDIISKMDLWDRSKILFFGIHSNTTSRIAPDVSR
jgi:hypothetical protein